MSMIPTYACFGCVNWANNARTKAYIAWACATGQLGPSCIPPTRWMCSCPADDDTFESPIADEVCWYDPQIPESAQFLGAVIEMEDGLRNSTFTRELLDALGGGSILGTPKVVGKQTVLTILLYATTEAGMDYGIEWMRRLFEDDSRCPKDGASCSSCQGQLLTFRMHCADPETTYDDGLHSFVSGGTIDGLKIVSDDYPMGRACCNIVRRFTLTLGTESDISYGTNPVSTCTLDASDPAVFSTLGSCGIEEPDVPCCPFCSTGCDECTTDPGCDCIEPFILTPNLVSSTAPCLYDPPCICVGAASITNLPAGYDSFFRLTLFAGWDPSDPLFSKYGQRNTIIRVFENPEGFANPVTAEDYEALTSRQLPCAEIGVSWIPPGSELVIDGLSGRMWLKCNGRCVDHSERVSAISGDVFPLIARCTDVIIAVEWDCLNVQNVDDPMNPAVIPARFTLETFTGHKL